MQTVFYKLRTWITLDIIEWGKDFVFQHVPVHASESTDAWSLNKITKLLNELFIGEPNRFRVFLLGYQNTFRNVVESLAH